jgi:hypothetical protein
MPFRGCGVDGEKGKTGKLKRGWETARDNLGKARWNCGYISSSDRKGRQFWVVAAERRDAGRFIVQSDEMLAAFLELESAIWCQAELE